MGGLVIKGPNGSDAVTLQQSTNVTKVVEASDIASDAFVKGRMGTGGAFSFRNKIVDGRFDFWYEGTTQTSSGYGSDTMWQNSNEGSTKVHSRQTLTAGVDLPAIECPSAQYFSRTVVTSVTGANNYVVKWFKIENVGTLAGKTVTLSFYAKADAAKNIAFRLEQQFGTSGSTPVTGIGSQTVALSTSWSRYSRTFTIPSVSGKTIGAGSFLHVIFGFDIGSNYASMYANLGQQSGTFDIACVQLEEGSVATPFEELPMEISQKRVERYYERAFVKNVGYATTTTNLCSQVWWKTEKRIAQYTVSNSEPAYINANSFSYQTYDEKGVLCSVVGTTTNNVAFWTTITADARL